MKIDLYDSDVGFNCIVDAPYPRDVNIISSEIESTLLKNGKVWILNLTYRKDGFDPWRGIVEKFGGKYYNIGTNTRSNQDTFFPNEPDLLIDSMFERRSQPKLDYFNDPVEQHQFMNYFDFDVGNVKPFVRGEFQDKFVAIAEMVMSEILKSDQRLRKTIIVEGIWNLFFEDERFLQHFFRTVRKFNASIITNVYYAASHGQCPNNNISLKCAKENSSNAINARQ